MNQRLVAILTFLALGSVGLLAPEAATAQRFHGGMGRGFASAGAPPVAHSFGPRSFASHSLSARPNGFHSRFSAHHFHHRHFRNFGYGYFGAIGAPLAVYAPPFSAYGSGFYDDSPAYYPEPVVSAPIGRSVSLMPAPPSAPPAPTVVEFPTGRYELRGDGLTAPYTWVWIPNPPSAPPASSVPPSAAPSSGNRPQLYRWTDEQGVVHLTDQAEKVPQQYRNPAKQSS